MNDTRSDSPAVVDSVGAASPEANSYTAFQVIVLEPDPPWVMRNVIRCPFRGFDGAPIVREAAIVTRKSLPALASTAIVAASESVTTAGDAAPKKSVVVRNDVPTTVKSPSVFRELNPSR